MEVDTSGLSADRRAQLAHGLRRVSEYDAPGASRALNDLILAIEREEPPKPAVKAKPRPPVKPLVARAPKRPAKS